MTVAMVMVAMVMVLVKEECIMDSMDMIRTAHIVDRQLGVLGAAVTEATLQERISSFQSEWREVTHAVTAHFCGLERTAHEVPGAKRSRRRKGADTLEESREGGRVAGEVERADGGTGEGRSGRERE